MSGSQHKARVFSGRLANDVGKTFESLLQVTCAQHGMGFIKIPDGCYRIKHPWGTKLIATRTPFDFIICKTLKSAAIDAKTIEGDRFAFSAIDPHQVDALSLIGEHLPAGYVIWYRKSDKVVFYDHTLLRALKRKTSFTDSEGLLLGKIDTFNPELILNTPIKTYVQGSLL